jgi:hypothetical protein
MTSRRPNNIISFRSGLPVRVDLRRLPVRGYQHRPGRHGHRRVLPVYAPVPVAEHAARLDEASGGRFDLGGEPSAARGGLSGHRPQPMNTHAPKRIPCVTFEITDLQHQRSSSGVLTLGFSQITQGAGFTARTCPAAPPKRGPSPAPRRALRLDDPLLATPLIAGSERTHLPN